MSKNNNSSHKRKKNPDQDDNEKLSHDNSTKRRQSQVSRCVVTRATSSPQQSALPQQTIYNERLDCNSDNVSNNSAIIDRIISGNMNNLVNDECYVSN